MVQVLPANPSFGERLGLALGRGIGQAGASYYENKQMEPYRQKANDPNVPQNERIAAISRLPKQEQLAYLTALKLQPQESSQIQAIKQKYGVGGLQPEQPVQQPAMQPMALDQIQPLFMQQQLEQQPAYQNVAPEQMLQQDNFGIDKPYPQEDILALSSSRRPEDRKIADVMQKTNDSLRAKEIATSKNEERKLESALKETAPLRKEYAELARSSEELLRNKKAMKDIIKNNNIDSPLYAQLAETIPYKLADRFLSDDTVKYRSALFSEYGILRQMFSGATRVAEIEALQDKLAGLWLTDSQKEAVLDSGIDAAEANLIKADVAAQIEDEMPHLRLAGFEKELQKRSKPLIDKKLNELLETRKQVIKQAEEMDKYFSSFKGKKLDVYNEKDREVAKRIKQEANGNPKEMERIAKRYKIRF